MTREELDKMWQKALHESVAAGEQYTRYHFAAMVAEREREACAKLCEYEWGTLAEKEAGYMFSAAIRARSQT